MNESGPRASLARARAHAIRLRSTLINLGAAVQLRTWAGLHAHSDLNLDNPAALRMLYPMAAAAGTLSVFLAMWWR
jgi:hypothetical protein